MHIQVTRSFDDENATVGTLSIDGKAMCYTLEDAYHEEKIYGKTRIPDGSYSVELRNEGSKTQSYLNKYGEDFHKGMLWLRDVENYTYVYIHTGNKATHTEGCLLVGLTADIREGKKVIGHSVSAYKEIYPMIADAIITGEEVVIDIS